MKNELAPYRRLWLSVIITLVEDLFALGSYEDTVNARRWLLDRSPHVKQLALLAGLGDEAAEKLFDLAQRLKQADWDPERTIRLHPSLLPGNHAHFLADNFLKKAVAGKAKFEKEKNKRRLHEARRYSEMSNWKRPRLPPTPTAINLPHPAVILQTLKSMEIAHV